MPERDKCDTSNVTWGQLLGTPWGQLSGSWGELLIDPTWQAPADEPNTVWRAPTENE